MIYQVENILLKAEEFVTQLFESKLSSSNFYHSIDHTKKVVKDIVQLSKWEGCAENEQVILEITAWFHDTGYVEKDDGHEEVSVHYVEEFLQSHQFPSDQIELIKGLIFVSRKGATAETNLEKIVKDADCAHLASPDYFEISNLLKREISIKKDCEIDDLAWLEENKKFFENHQFYTESAKLKWQAQKDLNLREINSKIIKVQNKKKEKYADKRIGRGVETLFRVQLKNHIELSSIADTKANILLSVNAIIISVALSSLVPRLDSPSNAFLVWPTFILLVFSVTAVVLSVISTIPNVSNVTVTRDMIKNKQTNILFFGNFYKMTLEDFEWGVDYLIENDDVLYNSLTKDLYFLGLVLERKYRILRITYRVFMVGIIVSAIAFVFSYYQMMNP